MLGAPPSPKTRILGTGHYAPARVAGNADLERPLQRVGDDPRVRQHDAPGAPGGTAGVIQREQIIAAVIGGDETEAFRFVKPFDGTSDHKFTCFLKTKNVGTVGF